jgi:DNA sulfur modification protein DndE
MPIIDGKSRGQKKNGVDQMRKAKMKTRMMLILGFMLVIISINFTTDEIIHIYLIGDSTMANKPLEDNPERGWGQMFHEFFTDDVIIHNHAVNGRSTKSFIKQNRWQAVLDSLQPGDYVMIQFGHNDQKIQDSSRYAAPHGAYKENLQRFVNESRAKGAQPILITPVARRNFDEQHLFVDTHGDYPDVVREVAREDSVLLIDVHQSSRELIISMGDESSKGFFLWVAPGQSKRFPDGKQDNTHFNERGARAVAELVVQGLKLLDLPLAVHIKK